MQQILSKSAVSLSSLYAIEYVVDVVHIRIHGYGTIYLRNKKKQAVFHSCHF